MSFGLGLSLVSTMTPASIAHRTGPSARNVEVAGGSIYVEESGDGPPLVLIHGWPLDHRLFEPQSGPLSESLTVIAYDRRGFGRSHAPPDLRAEIDDIDRLLDALELQSAHILGMSQGGRIALRYAATRPERVRSLILQGAVVDGLDVETPDDERVPVDEFAKLAKTGRLDTVIEQWLEHPMMRLPDSDSDSRRLLDAMMCDYAGRDLIELEAGDYDYSIDVLERMTDFDKPVLVITGVEETATRHRHAEELLKVLADGREVVLQHSGHLANLTEPDAYNAAVLDFVHTSETS